jgi:hypothetical protein
MPPYFKDNRQSLVQSHITYDSLRLRSGLFFGKTCTMTEHVRATSSAVVTDTALQTRLWNRRWLRDRDVLAPQITYKPADWSHNSERSCVPSVATSPIY